jgi:hypothetical protein
MVLPISALDWKVMADSHDFQQGLRLSTEVLLRFSVGGLDPLKTSDRNRFPE